MSVSLIRKLSLAAVGLVALVGFAGCKCTGTNGSRPQSARANKNRNNQPLVPSQEDILLERIDAMNMNMDSRFSSVERDISYLRDRPVQVVEQPVPVVTPPVQDYTDYELFPLPPAPQQPRYVPTSAARPTGTSLAAQHLRVPGVTVRQLQQALLNAGFSPGKIDGAMGKNTISAITAFQRENGLKTDGICGRQTWARLEALGAPAGGSGYSTVPVYGS